MRAIIVRAPSNKIARRPCIASGKVVYSLLLIAIERSNALMHEKSYRPANLPRIAHNDIRGDATWRCIAAFRVDFH